MTCSGLCLLEGKGELIGVLSNHRFQIIGVMDYLLFGNAEEKKEMQLPGAEIPAPDKYILRRRPPVDERESIAEVDVWSEFSPEDHVGIVHRTPPETILSYLRIFSNPLGKVFAMGVQYDIHFFIRLFIFIA